MARAVRRAEQEPAAARASLRARADDREIDRNHRQHARREVQREPAEQDDQQDRERSAAFEQPARDDALFGVAHELQEVVAAEISARVPSDVERLELREGRAVVGRCRTARPEPGPSAPLTRRGGSVLRPADKRVNTSGAVAATFVAGGTTRSFHSRGFGARLEADLVVARLITQSRRNRQLACRQTPDSRLSSAPTTKSRSNTASGSA